MTLYVIHAFDRAVDTASFRCGQLALEAYIHRSLVLPAFWFSADVGTAATITIACNSIPGLAVSQ